MPTDAPNTNDSPDAIRASFHAAHTSLVGSGDFEGFRDWGEKMAAYVGQLHDKVAAQDSAIANLNTLVDKLSAQMAAVVEGVAELAGPEPTTSAAEPAADADPAPVVETPATPAADPAPVEAAAADPAPAADPSPADPAAVAAATDPAPVADVSASADAPAAS